MQTYLLQILTMSFLCGLIEMLAPQGEREGLRRAVRLVSALCLLTVMIAPLRAVGGMPALPDLGAWARGAEAEAEEKYEGLMREKLTAVSEAQLSAELYEVMEERFGLGREDCTVTVEWVEGENLAVRHVWVALRGRGILVDPRRVEREIGALLGCGCTASVG